MNSLKKIYDIEVTPPAGAWNNIARELDEIEKYKSLAENITTLEVAPPPALWAKIAGQLEETRQEQNMAARFYNLESEVPAMAWDRIQRELDDQEALEIIEKKLSGLQVTPPPSAWKHIKTALNNQGHKSLVVPMHHGWLKYAAAACFIAIISITAFFILEDSHENNAGNSIVNAGGGNTPSPVAVKQSQPSQAAQSSKEHTLASIRTKLGNAYAVSMEANTDLQNRYIILMTEDGNIVRMSKKVSNMADCIAGEDKSCDDQLSKWQKEMANNAAAAGPDNFLDILDIASGSEQVIN